MHCEHVFSDADNELPSTIVAEPNIGFHRPCQSCRLDRYSCSKCALGLGSIVSDAWKMALGLARVSRNTA
jgi:hypothetical protein